jgi:uncharacterized protein (PEP-CTERM system associated)
MGNSDGDTLSFNLNSGSTFRRVGWGLSASHSTIKDSIAPESTVDNANLNLRYLIGSSFSATASGGYDRYDYQALAAGPPANPGPWASSGRRAHGPP